MKTSIGLSDSVAGVVQGAGKCEQCGATTRLGQGLCVSCLFNEGLGREGEASTEVFESVLEEANVPDTQWRLGNYEILEEIGRGGMGVIYRARQRYSRRFVALKRVLTYHADSHETLARFRREAEAAASLDHPNILPIYEVTETEEGLPFFSMKLATGGSLRTVDPALRNEPRQCVQLMAKVARAIEYAHAQGILHRDLQPGNILLDARGEPLVSDFGLAKWLDKESDLTQTLTTFGTPGYIAPEPAEGADFSPAADIYGLGAILFNLLAGRPPFVGPNALSVIRQAAAMPAPKLRSFAPSVGRDLETIIARCLERDPKARYQSAAALGQDLERWIEGRPIIARPVSPPARLWRWSRRNPVLAGAAIACLFLTIAVGSLLRERFSVQPSASPSDKSIAVLPFENFSDNKENSYFAAGIQDDVLTSLAQIHDLKVISRTSVMPYQKSSGRNMRDISQALGVANVLEGSVRRTGNRVLVNVQLIDARNDRHIWAERYDRAVADSIGLQGELAAEIAKVLQAKLDSEEKASLGTKPTNNPEAYVLYLRALELEQNAETLKPPLLPTTEDWKAVAQLYAQAIALDPAFALARARASISYSQQFFQTQDSALKAKARTLAEEALRLSPALGDAHLALGLFFYLTERNYTAALEQFTIALTALPNNVEVLNYIARIYRQQGRWRAAIGGFEQARSLNPRVEPLELVFTYLMVRYWRAAAAAIKRIVALTPDEPRHRVGLAQIEVVANCDLAAARAKLREIPAGVDPDGVVTLPIWNLSMLERDFATAEKWLADFPSDKFPGASPKSFYQAQTALARGDVELARTLFEKVRPALESNVRDHPAAARHHAALGILYGYMGRKEDAIRESRRAVELCPESTDAVEGVQRACDLALVYALTGEVDQALPLVERLLRTPGATTRPRFYDGGITQAELRLRWQWDKLRGDPRFKKMLDGPEPKTVY